MFNLGGEGSEFKRRSQKYFTYMTATSIMVKNERQKSLTITHDHLQVDGRSFDPHMAADGRLKFFLRLRYKQKSVI